MTIWNVLHVIDIVICGVLLTVRSCYKVARVPGILEESWRNLGGIKIESEWNRSVEFTAGM